MPKIDHNEYNAAQATGGSFERMPAGGYVCAIQAIRTSGTNSSGRLIDYIAEMQYVKSSGISLRAILQPLLR